MIRLFNHYLSIRLILLTLVEAAVVFQSVLLGHHLRVLDWSISSPLREAGIFTAIMLTMMSAFGLYQSQAEAFRTTVQRVLIAYGISLILMTMLFYIFPATYISRGAFAILSLFAIGGVLAVRFFSVSVTDIGLPKRRILVMGNGPEAETVIRFLNEGDRSRAVQYAGLYPVIADSDAGFISSKLDHEQLRRTVSDLRVSEIVVAVKERRGGVLPLRQLLDCKLRGVRVMDLTSFYERELGQLRIDSLRASWLIFSDGFDRGVMRSVIKRVFDVIVSMLILLLSSPLWIAGMLAIFMETGRPIFYKQVRTGQGNRPFTIFKMRSMRQDAEKDGKPVWAGSTDSRVTRVGKFLRKTRIDELPQLFNVLKGDMSFVGPRPERPFFVEKLLEDIPYYDVRHSVKPGITGWSQVRYPYGASVEDALAKLQYDLYYVKNHSLFLDLLIMMETLQVVVLGKGAR
jgi:sugar transferase (PEP-CTERM system associated)